MLLVCVGKYDSLIQKRYHEALGAMESAEVVSFDVFDTLLLRKVLQPVDVFRRMELELGPEGSGFCEWRIEAEREARRRAPESYLGEVTYEEIYDVLCEADTFWAGRRSELMAQELEIENDVTMAHPLGQALFARARALGRRIVLLSDMYLPESVIEELLRNNGYAGAFDLYVSNVSRQSKGQGALFQTVLDELGCRPDQVLHIGDNEHADYKMANKAGWRAVHVPKLSNTLQDADTERPLAESILEALRLKRRAEAFLPDPSHGFFERLGEDMAAPLYLGFIAHLIEQTKGRGLHRLFFCSRDGKIMKAVYDLLTDGNRNSPQSEYFLASRRASKVASFKQLGERELAFLMETGVALTIRDYLSRIHIEPEEVLDLVLDCGFKGLNDLPQSTDEMSRLKSLFLKLEPQILAIAHEERQAYLNYMETLGVFEQDLFALVDIGWNATVFGAMTKLVRERKPMCSTAGFFFGTFELAYLNHYENSSLTGYFFENCEPVENYHALKHSIALCEILFSAEEGSLLRFKQDGGSVSAEFDAEASSVDYSNAVRGIQAGALSVLREYVEASGGLHLLLDQRYATRPFVRLITQPTKDEATVLGDLPFWPEFGQQARDHYMARPSSLWRSLIRPYQMKQEYRKSYWRAGYYRRLPWIHRLMLRCICPDLKFAYKASSSVSQ